MKITNRTIRTRTSGHDLRRRDPGTFWFRHAVASGPARTRRGRPSKAWLRSVPPIIRPNPSGRPILDLISPDFAAEALGEATRSLRRGAAIGIQFNFRARSGYATNV